MVILPDATYEGAKAGNGIVVCDNGRPHWPPPRAEQPQFLSDLRDRDMLAARRERERLLYVAMTRARTWLVVCGAGKPGEASWHARVSGALESLKPQDLTTPAGTGRRVEIGDWSAAHAAHAPAAPPLPSLPAWATGAPPTPHKPPGTVSPSDLGGEKALPGESLPTDDDAALRRGRRIHLLLENLPNHPRDDWPDLAVALLATGADAADPATAAELLSEVAPVLDNPELAHLFAPGTLAEVPFACRPPELGGRVLAGAVDRLVVDPDRVLAIDFKSNALVPATPEAVPEGLKRQMGAYARALSLIYPDRRIDTAILWSRGPTLMPLPQEIVSSAWERRATT